MQVGYGDHTMATSAEVMFAIAKMALGASTFAVVVGNLAELLNKHDVREKLFKQRMEDLDDFMHQVLLPECMLDVFILLGKRKWWAVKLLRGVQGLYCWMIKREL